MPEPDEHMPGLMAERDGYIHGVPCAVDTMQPDPEAATHFYGGLFGCDGPRRSTGRDVHREQVRA